MKQLSLRLPDELYDKLVAAKDASRRSLHAEILFRLERSVEAPPWPPAEPQHYPPEDA